MDVDDRQNAYVTRIDGTPPPNTYRDPDYHPGYVYVEDELKHGAMFYSRDCRKYRVGDAVIVTVTLR